MTMSQPVHRSLLAVLFAVSVAGAAHAQQQAAKPFEPQVGQPGKDVVWVPTPPELVEKMLDMAQVTPQDFVVDLGSGDGRNVIGAAKRGARALGIEYNPDMVELSTRNAQTAGVGDKAKFVQGDMYASDFSQASVLALFLLPSNMRISSASRAGPPIRPKRCPTATNGARHCSGSCPRRCRARGVCLKAS
jgi:SAM-dependent methyltransferase